jgi:hypothetical protein
MELANIVVAIAGRDPKERGFGATAGNEEIETTDAVNGALRYRIAAELTVFGVTPYAFESLRSLFPDCPVIQSHCPVGLRTKPEVAATLVSDQTTVIGIVEGSIAVCVSPEKEIEMLKQPNTSVVAGSIGNLDSLDVNVSPDFDGIGADHAEVESLTDAGHVCDERFFLVSQVALPALRIEPIELTVDPNAKAISGARGLVLLADVGKVDIPHCVVGIKVDE